MNRTAAALTLALMFTSPLSMADAEIRGNASEIRDLIYPIPQQTTLHGHAEETAYSDKAIISLTFKTEDEQLADAINENKQLRQEIITQLTSNGISPQEIHNAKFSNTPQKGWFGKRVTSHEVINKVDVGIFNDAHLTILAAVADEHDEIELTGTRFEHTEKEAFKLKVKERALEKINAEKAMYEKTLGVKLIPIGIGRISLIDQPVRTRQMYMETEQAGSLSSLASAPLTDIMPVPISFDEVKYQANISVTFRIEEPGQ